MPLFQNESKCETFQYENQFFSQVHSNADLTHFHVKGFVLAWNGFETEAEGNSEMAYCINLLGSSTRLATITIIDLRNVVFNVKQKSKNAFH